MYVGLRVKTLNRFVLARELIRYHTAGFTHVEAHGQPWVVKTHPTLEY